MKQLLLLVLCAVQLSCAEGKVGQVQIASKDLRLIKNALLDEMGRFDRRLTLERETETQLILSQPIGPRIYPTDARWVLARRSAVGPGNRAAGWEWLPLHSTEDRGSLKSIALGRNIEPWITAKANGTAWAWFTLQPTPEGTLVSFEDEVRVFYLTDAEPAPSTVRNVRLPQSTYEPNSKPYRSETRGGIRIIGYPTMSGEMTKVVRLAKATVESGKPSLWEGWRRNLLRP